MCIVIGMKIFLVLSIIYPLVNENSITKIKDVIAKNKLKYAKKPK